MNNNKGFTLVEIIVCIALLLLIVSITTITIFKSKEESADEIPDNIKNAANIFLDRDEYYKNVLNQKMKSILNMTN